MGIRHNHVAAGANDPTREVSRDRWNEDHLIEGELQLGGLPDDPATPPDGTLWLNTTTGEAKVRSGGLTLPLGGGGGAVGDGDKGDITVSASGTVWTVDPGAITLAKLASIPTDSFLGRDSAETGVPEVMTPAQARSILNVADGATANATDAALRDRTAHTGVQPSTTISDFAEAVDDRVAALLVAGANVTLSYNDAGNVLTIAASGGSGSPGGTSGEVQWNNAGAFAGAANVEIESGNLKLMTTTDPAAPTGGLAMYAFNMAGRLLPKIIGPAGIDTALQVGLHGNSVILISPTSGTNAPSIIGGTLTTAATMSLQYTAGSSNRWASTSRKRFQTSATAGNASGMRLAYSHVHRGNAPGFGGFWFRAQFGMQINLNGGQKFVGLCASTAVLGGDPSALLNMCGMGYDAADAATGNWQFMRNDGSGAATKVDLGPDAARNTTDGYDLIMFTVPNGADLFVRIVNLNTGVVVLDTSYNSDLPAVNTGLCLKAEVRNGAVAAADNLEVSKVYIETDY